MEPGATLLSWPRPLTVRTTLRYSPHCATACRVDLYGTWPSGEERPAKPDGYDLLTWPAPPPPVADLAGELRARDRALKPCWPGPPVTSAGSSATGCQISSCIPRTLRNGFQLDPNGFADGIKGVWKCRGWVLLAQGVFIVP